MWIYLCFEIVQHEMNKILKGIINTKAVFTHGTWFDDCKRRFVM